MPGDVHLTPRTTGALLSPFEDILGDVGGLRGIPLDGVGVGLVARLCDDHLDRAVTTWKTVQGCDKIFICEKHCTRNLDIVFFLDKELPPKKGLLNTEEKLPHK